MVSIIGNQNAAVLPVPVCACQIISLLHSSKSGMVCSWIGDGSSNHFFCNAISVFSESQSAWNFGNIKKGLLIKNFSTKYKEESTKL